MTNFESKEKNLLICLRGKNNYYFGINFISVKVLYKNVVK